MNTHFSLAVFLSATKVWNNVRKNIFMNVYNIQYTYVCIERIGSGMYGVFQSARHTLWIFPFNLISSPECLWQFVVNLTEMNAAIVNVFIELMATQPSRIFLRRSFYREVSSWRCSNAARYIVHHIFMTITVGIFSMMLNGRITVNFFDMIYFIKTMVQNEKYGARRKVQGQTQTSTL